MLPEAIRVCLSENERYQVELFVVDMFVNIINKQLLNISVNNYMYVCIYLSSLNLVI